MTALCAALATEAAAQTPPPGGGEIVLNEQLQLGDVFSHQTINVVDASDQVTVSTVAQGNQASGAVYNGEITVQSNQSMQGDAVARTDLNAFGDTDGVVTVHTQAGGNYLGVSAYDADLTVDGSQTNTGSLVSAISEVGPTNARLLGGGSVSASATSNSTAIAGEASFIQGDIDQSSSATVRSFSRIQSQYIPAAAVVAATSAVNSVEVNGARTSGQNLRISQSSTGDFMDADASANAGNGWDLASRARGTANRAVLYTAGGSIVAETAQDNSADVRAAALTTAYDYGRAEAYARGVANDVSVGSDDVYVEIDNDQFNSGGVDVTSTVSGAFGYDVYNSAEAVGNNVVGFACAECNGYLEATNVQTNTGSISATATTTITGSNRAVITGATAIGNNANFYVSRPGG